MDVNILDNSCKINKNAFFICHGALSDIFNNFSAIYFLTHFYNKVLLLCPYKYLNNLTILFNNLNVEFITYDTWHIKNNNNQLYPTISNDWINCIAPILKKNIYENFNYKDYLSNYNDLSRKISNFDDAIHHYINYGQYEKRLMINWKEYINKYDDLSGINNKVDAIHHWENFGKYENRIITNNISDVFINGNICSKYISNVIPNNINVFFFKPLITHPLLVNYFEKNLINNTSQNNLYNSFYEFINIKNNYENIKLNLDIYFNYFNIPITDNSKKIYNLAKKYKIVFLHFTSSYGESVIPDNEFKHIYNDEFMIINPDKNHYNSLISPEKYEIANFFLNLPVLDYIDTIINAKDIYIIDSIFLSIIYPFKINNKLNATNIVVYDRLYLNIKNTPSSLKL
jgi:hypothetical protein